MVNAIVLLFGSLLGCCLSGKLPMCIPGYKEDLRLLQGKGGTNPHGRGPVVYKECSPVAMRKCLLKSSDSFEVFEEFKMG